MNIVLDKSFLQGSSKDKIHEMCSQYQIIMPEVLFLEILTTETENMVKCFKKFPQIENPVALVPNVGTLIRYETENGSQCTPIETQFLKDRYKFNESLAEGKFVFTEEQKNTLDEWKKITANDTAGFIEKATVADGWFNGLSEYKPGESLDPISNAMEKVAKEDEFVRKIYKQIRDEIYSTNKVLWPDPSKIGIEWVLFRHLQVHLVTALEYIRKYGKESKDLITKRLENDYLDIEYCITGTISDGLATRDKTMATFYNLLCPNKALIS
jgi:hypothetical protein